MKKQFIRVVLNGNKYYIDREADYAGWADNPGWDRTYPTIAVLGGMKNTQNSLDTFIHECLHGCDGSAYEPMVTQTAKNAAALLWNEGLRYYVRPVKVTNSVRKFVRGAIMAVLTGCNCKWDKLKIDVTARDIAAAAVKVGYRLK